MDDFITQPGRPSYACGISDVPLLGDTIGDNFDRTVAAEPRREALVEVATGRRWTYQELRAEVDAVALGLSTQTRTDDSLDRRVSTVGLVHPHLEVKIVDPETGLTVPRGEPGELCTRGYSVMLGYWNEPDKTAEAIDTARWMHTGDLAVMDSDGYLNITGRIKDMVIRGGETSTRGRSRSSFTPTQTSSTRR